MPCPIINLLSERIVVADGAMGTRLQALIGDRQQCIDSLNVDPAFSEIVAVVHRSYLEAGADLILTNTYGANAVKLGRYGRGEQATSINSHGARLARRCIDHWNPPDEVTESLPNPNRNRFVGGSVGPLEIYAVRDEYTEEQIEGVFAEQMKALVEGGVDLLFLETFQDLMEAQAAVRVAKRFHLPVFLTVGGVQGGHTGTGADAREFAVLANRMGIQAVGANCRGPFDILETIKLMAQVTSLPLLAKPNAGSPEIDRGRVAYNVDPEQFRRYALRLVEAGANLVGGCCGTDPTHIQQLSHTLQGKPAPPPRTVSEVRVFAVPRRPESPHLAPNLVEEVFRLPFAVSVEMRPHREKSLDGFLEAGRQLAAEGVHLFDVPDNAGARITVDPLFSAARLQDHTRIPTVMHLSTSHRNLVATQSYLLGCHHAGIQAILAVTGDHPNVGDHDKYATRCNDVKSSVKLMELAETLNKGRLFNESPCITTNFYIGGGFNPVRGLPAQLKWLQRKVDAGAKFIFTQPVYREEDVDRMLELTAEVPIPILVGMMPLTSRRNAEFFAAGKIPGIIIPKEILDRFEKVDDPADGRKLGLDLALELQERIKGKVRGLYLLPPFGASAYEMVRQMVRALDLRAS